MDRVPESVHTPYKTWAEVLVERGETEGVRKGKVELVSQMLGNGADWESIAKLTGITASEFEEMRHA